MGTEQDSAEPASPQRKIVFVLGGPGSGKGTQCGKLVADFDLVHLSAGELLRQHIASGSTEGKMVQEMIDQGQIVPSYVTVGLLQKAMDNSGRTQFLIDGFPRNAENHQAFLKTGLDCEFVLYFDCDEETMIQRLLARNEGRTDDNIDTIRKRFKVKFYCKRLNFGRGFQVFLEQTMGVVKHYEVLEKVRKVDAANDPDTVYSQVKAYFSSFLTRKEKQLVA